MKTIHLLVLMALGLFSSSSYSRLNTFDPLKRTYKNSSQSSSSIDNPTFTHVVVVNKRTNETCVADLRKVENAHLAPPAVKISRSRIDLNSNLGVSPCQTKIRQSLAMATPRTFAVGKKNQQVALAPAIPAVAGALAPVVAPIIRTGVQPATRFVVRTSKEYITQGLKNLKSVLNKSSLAITPKSTTEATTAGLTCMAAYIGGVTESIGVLITSVMGEFFAYTFLPTELDSKGKRLSDRQIQRNINRGQPTKTMKMKSVVTSNAMGNYGKVSIYCATVGLVEAGVVPMAVSYISVE